MVFQVLARIILRNRLTIVIAIGVITIFMLVMVTTLRFNYRPTPLLPPNDSLLVHYRGVTNLFGKGENIMVIGVRDCSFFELENFKKWQALEKRLRSLDGVENVLSIADIFAIQKNVEEKVFKFEKIFPDTIKHQSTLDSLKEVAFSLPFYQDILYNKDSCIFLMMVTLKYEFISTVDRVAFMDRILSICDDYKEVSGNDLRYSGLPYIRISVGEMIRSEMFMFLILAVLITAVLIYLLFKSFRIVLFSMLVVAVSVSWALGIMALLGFEITLLTAVIPPLITVIGVTNCVYLLNKYHHEYSLHGNKIKALQRVIQKIGSATFLTNLTTSAGFGTFAFTNIQILKEFGLVAAIDILGVYIISLLLIPAIFSYLAPPEPRHLQHLDNFRLRKLISSVINAVIYRRVEVFVITGFLVILGFWGLSRVVSNGYMVDDVPKNHPAYVDLKYFEKNFAGVMPLEIIIDTKSPRGVIQENNLRDISRLQNVLGQYTELSKPLSVVEAAKFARQGYYNGNPSQYKLPTGFERGFIMSYLPKNMGGNPLLNRFVDSTGRITRVLYNVADIGSIRINDLKGKLRTEIDSIFTDDSRQVYITGGSIIAAKGNDYLVKSLFISLLAAIAIISIFMAWMFRKTWMVFTSVLTNLIPLLLTSAAMGFIGISLKPSTVIVFSIAFGISVDNSIHFLVKYRQELKRTRNNIKAAIFCAIRETGVSMVYASIILFFGFGIFIASKFGGTVSLGILVSLTLLIALFCNLILLPSVLLWLGKGNDNSENPCEC